MVKERKEGRRGGEGRGKQRGDVEKTAEIKEGNKRERRKEVGGWEDDQEGGGEGEKGKEKGEKEREKREDEMGREGEGGIAVRWISFLMGESELSSVGDDCARPTPVLGIFSACSCLSLL